jgi:hypothetical protein
MYLINARETLIDYGIHGNFIWFVLEQYCSENSLLILR